MATATKPFEEMNTLWEILEAALEDVRKVEAMPDVDVDMGTWFYPTCDNRCRVCLAGAVMMVRLGANRDYSHAPADFVDSERGLFALDDLRVGKVGNAYVELHLDDLNDEESDKADELDRPVATYSTLHRAQWHADMDRLLTDLKAANI